MRDRFRAHGGPVVCNAEVTKITVEHGRAVGVQVHDQLVRVRRAVLADVAPSISTAASSPSTSCRLQFGSRWPVSPRSCDFQGRLRAQRPGAVAYPPPHTHRDRAYQRFV
jgi:hypothetical protein